jgi:L,D-peptidoglycan transpeptidase YkuD (ErfK/YbiS/YcfS/YnhG family)
MIHVPQSLPTGTRQLLLVTTESWLSTTGTLQRCERDKEKWQTIGNAIPVSVGKRGLAWGRGLNRPVKRPPQKKEGDSCAPAGIFALGPVFGYAPQAPAGCRLPYRAITGRDYFVDDPTSVDYNHWVTIPADKPNRPEKIWKSFERMKRPDHLYEIGIVIQQNDHPVMKGKGSAVFLHIWRKSGAPTVGCTAMAREDLLELLRWLRSDYDPLLVQAPVNEIENILPAVALPAKGMND